MTEFERFEVWLEEPNRWLNSAQVEAYFSSKALTLEGAEALAATIDETIFGLGKEYGSKHLVRYLHRVYEREFPKSPDYAFWAMSTALEPTYEKLKARGITDTKAFSRACGRSIGADEVAFITCYHLKNKGDAWWGPAARAGRGKKRKK